MAVGGSWLVPWICVVGVHGSVYPERMSKRRGSGWDAGSVRGLRRHMELTQDQLAEALGVRQQTVSEWETGAYQPRGASSRLLSIIADEAQFRYDPGDP